MRRATSTAAAAGFVLEATQLVLGFFAAPVGEGCYAPIALVAPATTLCLAVYAVGQWMAWQWLPSLDAHE